MTALVDRIRALLQGETVRVITYGAIAVVWLVTHAAFALGLAAQPPAFDVIAGAVSVGLAILNEAIRLYVSSPATVAAIVNTRPTGTGPIAAAESVGIDTSQNPDGLAPAPPTDG